MTNFLIAWVVLTLLLYIIVALLDGYARHMASGAGAPFHHLKAGLWSAVIALVIALLGNGIIALF